MGFISSSWGLDPYHTSSLYSKGCWMLAAQWLNDPLVNL